MIGTCEKPRNSLAPHPFFQRCLDMSRKIGSSSIHCLIKIVPINMTIWRHTPFLETQTHIIPYSPILSHTFPYYLILFHDIPHIIPYCPILSAHLSRDFRQCDLFQHKKLDLDQSSDDTLRVEACRRGPEKHQKPLVTVGENRKKWRLEISHMGELEKMEVGNKS